MMKEISSLVSVIVPNYNHARFLDERLQSILNQTYQNFELIILDDCSTDNSRDIIERYRANLHISEIVYNAENSGSPFKQWNKGIQLARGEIIWIAESDDSCEIDMLAKLVEVYTKADAVIAFTRSCRKNEKNKLLEFTFQDELKDDLIMEGRSFIKKYLGYKNIICNASGAIFSRKAAIKINSSYTTYKSAGDWLFWINIVRQGSVAFINTPLNIFRLQGSNVTQKAARTGIARIEDYNIYSSLKNQKLISNKQFNTIRLEEAKKIYFSHIFSSKKTKELLKMWRISSLYRLKFFITDLYIKWK